MFTFEESQKIFDEIKWAYIEDIEDLGGNELSFTLIGAKVSDEEIGNKLSDNAKLNEIFGSSKPIEITDSSPRYEVKFDSYIAISVINESYADNGDLAPPISGSRLRVYDKSHFLNFVSESTFATSDYPGLFKHYQFISLNHIIDVTSCKPPTITIAEAREHRPETRVFLPNTLKK